MTRHVFSNAQLRHVYASQSQDSGRNQKETARFEGPVFYSYRTPVAVILPDANGESVALVSSVSYSSTTSQHIPATGDFAGPAFSVPYLPGQYGGRYSPPPAGPRDSEAARAHAGNLAHLVKHAMEDAERMIRNARRIGRPYSWREDGAATSFDFNGSDSRFLTLAVAARDYARRFNLPAPTESELPADGGFSRYEAALAEWRAKEADPVLQRKRAADRRRREVRAEWMAEHADSILRAAGLNPDRGYNRKEIKVALTGIPATESGAEALRVRLADRRAGFERHNAVAAKRERERQEAAAKARAEEAAMAEAAGYTLADWRLKWGADYHAAEYDHRLFESARMVPVHRATWRAGGSPEWRDYGGGLWQACEAGGDMLRVKPGRADTLETARGAEVPVAHARRVWRHVLRIMCAGETWTGSIRCGHFTVSAVTLDGRMVAGCHIFHRAEMERVAALIGEPVTCEDVAGLPAETMDGESAS